MKRKVNKKKIRKSLLYHFKFKNISNMYLSKKKSIRSFSFSFKDNVEIVNHMISIKDYILKPKVNELYSKCLSFFLSSCTVRSTSRKELRRWEKTRGKWGDLRRRERSYLRTNDVEHMIHVFTVSVDIC